MNVLVYCSFLSSNFSKTAALLWRRCQRRWHRYTKKKSITKYKSEDEFVCSICPDQEAQLWKQAGPGGNEE